MSWLRFEGPAGTRGAQDRPCGRECHSADLVERTIVVFGGNGQKERYNDLFAYHVDSMAWEEIEPMREDRAQLIAEGQPVDPPDPKALEKARSMRAALEDYREKLERSKERRAQKNTKEQNQRAMELLERLIVASEEADRAAIVASTASPKPPVRAAHGSALIDARFLYVFWGWSGKQELDDMWRFDLALRRWRHLSWSSPRGAPKPRHFHAVTALGRKIFAMTGYDGKDWRNDSWVFDVGA